MNMKKWFLICILVVAYKKSVFAQSAPVSIYTIKIPLINETDTLNLSTWQAKKILIVNSASQSNYVNQYSQLEQLYQQFKDSGLVILACPSNNFGAEPYSNQQVQNFCSSGYGITYKLSRIVAVTGVSAHPLYQWLTQKNQNGVVDNIIRNDFTKFLINGQGQLVGFFDESINPLDAKVLAAIRAN